MHSPMGWVSYLHRAATTNYLCCGQALEDSLGAGRIGLTHTFQNLLQRYEKITMQQTLSPIFYASTLTTAIRAERFLHWI